MMTLYPPCIKKWYFYLTKKKKILYSFFPWLNQVFGLLLSGKTRFALPQTQYLSWLSERYPVEETKSKLSTIFFFSWHSFIGNYASNRLFKICLCQKGMDEKWGFFYSPSEGIHLQASWFVDQDLCSPWIKQGELISGNFKLRCRWQ